MIVKKCSVCLKKCLVATVMLTGLAAMTNAFASGSTGPFGWEHTAVGEFPEVLTFRLAAGAPSACKPLPVLSLIVSRNHPVRPSQLKLPSDSPYSSVTLISSDPFDSTIAVRHYVDAVTYGQKIITLNGQSKPRGGTWSDGDGCTGTFEAV